MPDYLQKFDLFKPMHGMWESYMTQLIKVIGKMQLASTLLSADLHGAFMFASFIGVQGIMVRETSETCGIITRYRKISRCLKALSPFICQNNLYLPKPNLAIVINLIQLLLENYFTSRENIVQC
ncbi:hypothetical protein CARUB_v10018563mg [Capsella rubella]|uniref:Uncharacterized protein n=1 Tax=Capsella rubella TaxID=81985 RepID=R0HMS6_9BRAS|nr:hypothetical protein CARUB_v10018563mg [Capsella rubella]